MSINSPSDWSASDFFNSIPPIFLPLFRKGRPIWDALNEIAELLKVLPLGLHQGTISPKAELENPELITISPGAIIEAFATIKGPTWIGPGVEVRQGAYIRGNVIVGENAVVGHTTEIKNSCLFPGVHADHFAYIGDSILGNGVHLGAGVILANLRLDHQEIKIQGKETGRRKFGAILGDKVAIGCNSVINPGSLLLPESRLFPQINWGGVLLKGKTYPAR